ncbi:MAG: phage tail length tape measure family protein [Shewanella sp.]
MADLASLKISVDSTDVRKADADLVAMSNSAGRTSASMDKMIAANNRMSAALQTSNKATIDAVKYLNGLQYELETVGKSALQLKAIEIRMAAAKAPTVELQQEIRSLGAQLLMAERNAGRATGGGATGITGLGNSSKLAAHHSQNLFFQLQDVFVGLTSGQKPMTVFIQQGSQIAGIMAQAQLGVMGVVRAIGSMIASVTMAVVTNPILMGIAAAAGAVGLAFNFMADDISEASGVTVTAGDVMMGAFDVVRNFLSRQVTAAFAYFGTTAGEVWNSVVSITRKAVNIIIGIVSFIPRAFVEAFKSVPIAINQLMDGNFSGALATIGGSMGKIAGDTFGRDYIGEIGSVFSAAAVNRAIERKAQDAGKKIGRSVSAGAAAGVADGRKEFVDATQAMIAEINTVFGKADDERMRIIVEADQKELERTMQEFDRLSQLRADERTRVLEQNLKTANDGARMIANVIGGSIGDGVKQLSDVLSKSFPDFMQSVGKSFDGVKNTFNDLLSGLGTSLKQLGAFAGVGGAAARATGGSALGGSIGGALGGVAGEAFKALGKFGGPLGAIAGGILGGVIGGLLKKTKSASATISAAAGKLDVGAIVGNNAEFKQTANTLAGAVVSGLNNAANALGAEITNALNISIGQRKDKFVVDTLGQGRTKGSGTTAFATEAEAVAFAIDNAIRSGVLGGLRSGTQRLLQGFGDVEARLAEAVDFENVFKAMEESADPVTSALGNLDKKFAGLIETFRKAGATAEEFATLEKYYQRERLKTIEQANQAAIEKANTARDALIEAYDRESEAILTTLERFKGLTASLQDFRLSLSEQLMTAEQIYQASRAKFEEISKLAAEGNEDAISQLVGVSRRYLDAAKTFLTPDEYNREIENVMKAVDLAIVQTKTLEEYAQSQLDALNASVDGLITLNESTLSVADAIKNLQAAIAERDKTIADSALRFEAAALTEAVDGAIRDAFEQYGGDFFGFRGFASGGDFGGGLRVVGENGPELEATGPSRIYNAAQTAEILSGGGNVADQIANLRNEMKASLYAIAKNTGKTSDQLNRWDGDGLPEARNWVA